MSEETHDHGASPESGEASSVPTTVGELGYETPIGADTFSFRPWTAKEEIQIGKIREKNPMMNNGQYVTEVLAYFLESFGGEATEPGKSSRLALKNQLRQKWGPDILYMWVMLRIEALGEQYPMGVRCPRCRDEFTFSIDLSGLPVIRPEGKNLRRAHQLRRGIKFQEKYRTVVTTQPMRWFSYEEVSGLGSRAGGGFNTGLLKAAVVRGAVCGLEGVDTDLKLQNMHVESIVKRDLEELVSSITDETTLGPDLEVEVTCPGATCGFELRATTVDWSYDSFFSQTGSSK